MESKRITVGELRIVMLNELNSLNDEDEVTFGGGMLTLYRVKHRGPVTGPKRVDIEFNEVFNIAHDPSVAD